MASPPRFASSVCGNCSRMFALVLSALVASIAGAAPVSFDRVQELAGGIASSVQISYAAGAAVKLAQAVAPAEAKVTAVASAESEDTAFYVIDRGSAGGFVVMSADDRLDPVLVIAPTGHFDPTPGTPLYDILCGDVRERIAVADKNAAQRSDGWRLLLEADGGLEVSISHAGIDIADIDDLRVAPLVKSEWNQSYVGSKKVYNYYTPKGYVCGCVATAGAQIMRFHEYPKGDVAVVTRTCSVDGASVSKETKPGSFSWSDMPLVPTSSITEAECEAIGKLCFNVGVSVYMGWGSNGSGAGAYCLKDAFKDVFRYDNAIAFQLWNETMSGGAVENALLANFDAGYPVEISIDGTAGGHSIVGDGYGYSQGSLYVHLNLGWGGSDDAWYHLPNIGTWAGFNVVDGTVYNIFPEGTGDLLTGRVTDAATGKAISGATVKAFNGSTVAGSAMTGATGIYALRLPGGKRYSVVASAPGADDSTLEVYLTQSESTRTREVYFTPGTGTIGNSWGNDFELSAASEPVAPVAPSTVSASDGTSTAKIRVTWSASDGATYYKVYRSTSNSVSSATPISSSVNTFYYDDTSVIVGTTYYYWVKAGNSVGESDFSSSDSGWRAYAVPDAPTGVSATDGTSTTGVAVTWTASSHADSYSVYRATSESATKERIASGLASTSFVDTTATAGTTYWYWVTASNSSGTSDYSASDTGYRKVAAPSAPTGVRASDGESSTEIVVSWNAVASADSYSVWRGTSSASSLAILLASGLTITSYSDTSAVVGTTYYYWVKASNVGDDSGFSVPDTGCLANTVGPTSVTATDGTYDGYVRVTWTASQGATSYEIWRGTVNAYSQATKIGSPTATSYNDTSAAPGMRYWYWVRAVTSAGTSAFSSSDSGFRPLSVPTGVSATTGNATGVTVSWSSVTGATSYQVGRGAEGASTPSDTNIGTATTLSFKDTTAVPGVTYAYFVRAVASACTSGWSSPTAGSRLVPTPTELTATDGTYTDRILVSWPALYGATSYELMRSDEDDISFAETIATTTATSFSDSTAEYGLTYYYFLRARFAAGTSPWSESEAGCRAFPAPTGVSATKGSNTSRITVSWDAIEGATLFQVWRYSNDTERNELIGTSTSTSYNDSKNIAPGVKYMYYVKAVFPTGTSNLSNPGAEGYLKASSPVVVASDGTSTSQISLTWNAVSGARTYLVYRSTSSAAPSSADEPIASTSMLYYNDKDASRGQLYYYWVRTATRIDTSDFGSADTGYVALPASTRVTATDGAYADRVEVSWREVSGATSYEIWRGTSSDSTAASRVARNVKTATWDDTSATPGQKCWYWVRACDAGPGLWSVSDTGWRSLSAPTEVTATTNLTDGVKVSWKGTTAGVSFEIKRGVSDDFESASVEATVSGSANYTDNTAVPGYRYYYWVRAYSDLDKNAAWSGMASGFRAVAAPATVSASDGTSLDAVTITWTAATSAKRYEIYRSTTTKTDDAEQIGTTNKLVWVDSAAEAGVTYYYWIKSVSALDTSAFSNRDSGYVSTPAPTDVTASDGFATNYVRIAWTQSEGALSYAIWRAETNDVAAATQVKTGQGASPYDDTSAIPGKFYWYWVRPVSAAGPGVFAGPDRGFASLSAPVNVVATSNIAANVTVSWKKTNGAVSYEVFRAETNDVEFATNDVFMTVTTTSFADTNAVPAVKYWYWVRACAEADISPLGGPADGFRLLSAPTGVMATDGTSDEYVRVTWNEAWGAKSYEVWRAENSTSTSAASLIVCVTNELEYLDATVNPGTSYTYWLKAVSELYTTGFSGNDRGWRSLPAPASVSASDGTTSAGVIVNWDAVVGAIKYEVWRCEDGTASTNRVFTSSDATLLTYTDTSAKAGTKYWYWVRTVAVTGTGVFGASDDGFRAVAAPTNLKATDGTSYDYVRVSWTAATGAESYEICRVPTNELYVATNYYYVTGTTFDDTNAVPGVVYGYSVRTISPLSTSDFAGPDDGWRKFRSVTNLAASDGTSLDAVELSWTMPEGAEKCNVWRSTGTSVGAAVKIATVDESAYSDTNALHGVKYYYWVNAVADVEGEKGTSNDGWRALYAPGNIVATDGDSTSHTRITWTESPDATWYKVFRGNSDDTVTMSEIAKLNASVGFLYEDKSGVAGSNYWYSVRAVGSGGESELGVPDSGYKALDATSAGVSATDGTLSGQVRVTWNKVTGATHYQVYRADNDAGEKTPCSGWQTETTFIDKTCRAGVRYWYYIKAAVDGTGARSSAFSGGNEGYTNEDGTGADDLDLGGGISWPVIDNGDGTKTTNAIAFASVDGGRLTFSGVSGEVDATTTVQTLVKTSLDSESVYTVPATLRVVSAGMAELDLSGVWGTRPSLFVLGITTEEGEVLP